MSLEAVDSLIEAWTDYLAALGVSAAVMVPDVLTLPEPMLEDTLTAVSFGDGVALRGRRFAATVQPDLVDLVAAGRSVAACYSAELGDACWENLECTAGYCPASGVCSST